MSRLIFDKRLLQIIVLLAHLCLVALAVIFAQSFDDTTINRVMSLESVQADFDVIKLSYIGYAREIGHIVSGICGLFIGIGLIKYGMMRKHEVATFFSIALGTQILLGALMSLALAGTVYFGSAWHLVSMGIGTIKAGSLVITSAVMIIYWKSLMTLGRKEDQAIGEVKDTL